MKNCITTCSKIQFDIMNPKSEDIKIEDIAHALSMIVRANGQYPEFFSVGQHCIQCAKEAMIRHYVPEVSLACLLHDASEAYISDVSSGAKKYMTMYLQIENQIQGMVYKKYLGEVPMGEASVLVQGIDDACYYYELKHFMDIETQPQEPMILGDASYEFQPFEDVEKEFLKIFNQLMAEINTTKLGNPYTVKDKSAKLDVKFKNV
ncbi:hypothetical protein SAMN04487761_10777 [Lachnospiraceae bacterium C7]|nr:hypothetical protein SAMN04487761_10777 [Lachnospiraceae bacterium C7]